MTKKIVLLLAFSLAACGRNQTGDEAGNATTGNASSDVNAVNERASPNRVAMNEGTAALPERKYAELKREGFTASALQIVKLTPPHNMPNGGIAEGVPIWGFRARKNDVMYDCIAPESGAKDWTEAEMADWICERDR